jgi:glutamyl-tRNA synthetase
VSPNTTYRGRIAPSPTGFLHLGHARTFWIAQERARQNSGTLILRNEDLDAMRCKPEFVSAMYEDLRWFGFEWQEGPDCGGPFVPYSQSERKDFYHTAFNKLRAGGFIYPCSCSRKDVLQALQAPHAGDEEPVYPGTCRNNVELRIANDESKDAINSPFEIRSSKFNWRFRVPDGETISFVDGNFGPQQLVAGKDFGDFVVWRNDDVPAYQLAVVADDAAMEITEAVRGADLLLSTARQILIYRALGLNPPGFYHCDLMLDEKGVRLAKRHDALSLRALRILGLTPEILRGRWNQVRYSDGRAR